MDVREAWQVLQKWYDYDTISWEEFKRKYEEPDGDQYKMHLESDSRIALETLMLVNREGINE